MERGREMYSARLVKEDFLAVKKIVKAMERHEKRPEVHYILRKFEKSLEAANRVLLAWKKECDEFEVISDAGMLEFALLRVAGDYELVAKEYPVLPERDTILSLYFDVRGFLQCWKNLMRVTGFIWIMMRSGSFALKSSAWTRPAA